MGTYWSLSLKINRRQLERVQRGTEVKRCATYSKTSKSKAANYDAYRAAALRKWSNLSALCCSQLPGKTEIPELDRRCLANRIGCRACRRSCFNRRQKCRKDFYAEKPITISLSGGYHEIANFVSGIAALPRIVTLHDIIITPDNPDDFDSLTLQVTAKTYRYIEEEAD